MAPRVFGLLRAYSFLPAAILALVLLVANVIALPEFGNPDTWTRELAVFAPFALLAMASTPAVVSGRGGLDLSVAPLANLASVVLVVHLLPGSLGRPAIAIPIMVGIGAAIGAANGLFVTVLRYQPVIATLSMLLVISGVNLKIIDTPRFSPPGNWTAQLADHVGPIPGPVIMLAAPVLVWLLLQRLPFYRLLFAIGGDDAAAFSAGVNVTAVRVAAYTLGGAFAGWAGLSLAALAQSADPALGLSYALIALAAVALGGTPVGLGGRGGIVGAIAGAAVIYLVQSLMLGIHVDSLWVQVVYGFLLVGGAILAALLSAPLRPGRRGFAGGRSTA